MFYVRLKAPHLFYFIWSTEGFKSDLSTIVRGDFTLNGNRCGGQLSTNIPLPSCLHYFSISVTK